MKAMSKALFVIAILVMAATAFAQSTPGTDQNVYQVNYFSGNRSIGAPIVDAAVRIINTGRQGGPLDGTTGYACANIYVFDTIQEMVECCACPLSPNSLLALSIKQDLTCNTLTGDCPNSGVIKIVSAAATAAGTCNPASAPIALSPGSLKAWGVHIQTIPVYGIPSVPVALTETQFAPADLGGLEQTFLQTACQFVTFLGSGRGVCTCGPTRANNQAGRTF